MRHLWRACAVILILIFYNSRPLSGRVSAQDGGYRDEAGALLEAMSPRERVGQLFMVTFEGGTADNESPIAELITDYHVGGVLLLAENDNFSSSENAALSAANLSNQLQQLSIRGYADIDNATSDEEPLPVPGPQATIVPQDLSPENQIPLFIATLHEGGGAPYTEIRSGLTSLPSPMALGATWQPDLARDVGRIAGVELGAIGVNLLIGPSLDVLEDPLALGRSDLGTRTFGGDPFWVGVMGQAYTTGVHEGGGGRIAVIAKHFPGYGSSDRPLELEVGTVRKSLEQLKQIELAPFFSVTGDASDSLSRVDGLLSAHVRYQGFQGNIRATTAPVSFDPAALATLMQLEQFSGWRQEGGIIVSDSLGVPAVENFYDASRQEFPHRLIAKDALLAGNDLLTLSDFSLGESGYNAELANIKDTINWFNEKYETDQTFQQRVDEAVLKILQLKLRLYGGNFALDNAVVDTLGLNDIIGQSESTIFNIAQEAVTLISPETPEIIEQQSPGPTDDIVVFTDLLQSRQCSTCPLEPWLAPESLEARILALYGPNASNQVSAGQIESFTFEQLSRFLTTGPLPLPTPEAPFTSTDSTSENQESVENITPSPTPTPTLAPIFRIDEIVSEAEWIIFAFFSPDPQRLGSDALELFLAQRPDIIREANVVSLAFGAPYFLDTTEVSRLFAYYGIYSKEPAFVDAAVRAIFQESPLRGKPPVSVEGVGYDLFEITKPDPSQVIALYIVDDGLPKAPPNEAPLEAVPGATLRLQTGVILDYNGNPVPNGTPVQFIQQDRIQGFVNVIAERGTLNGVANLDYLLEARAGNFRITTTAADARASQEVDIVIGENAVVSINTPTPAPTPTSLPTSTATPTTTPTSEPTLTPSPTPRPSATPVPQNDIEVDGEGRTESTSERIAIFIVGLTTTGVAGYLVAGQRRGDMEYKVRCALWSVAGGLIFYNYVVLGLPGSEWIGRIGNWSKLIVTLVGGSAGLFVCHLRSH